MDCRHYITDLPERKSGQHLQREERGAIQALKWSLQLSSRLEEPQKMQSSS